MRRGALLLSVGVIVGAGQFVGESRSQPQPLWQGRLVEEPATTASLLPTANPGSLTALGSYLAAPRAERTANAVAKWTVAASALDFDLKLAAPEPISFAIPDPAQPDMMPGAVPDPEITPFEIIITPYVQADRPNEVSRVAFPQWSGVMEKSWAWDVMFDAACDDIMGRNCRLRDWQVFLDRVRRLDSVRQLAAVNREINRVRYREDPDVWGEHDYWAAPGEFFARGGDCEDYAIAKYYSLRELGFSPTNMRVVVLQDVRRARPHAVLVVDLGGREFMLDNLSNAVVPWDTAFQYKPYYAVNEETFWVFRKDLVIGPAIGPTRAPPPPTIIIE